MDDMITNGAMDSPEASAVPGTASTSVAVVVPENISPEHKVGHEDGGNLEANRTAISTSPVTTTPTVTPEAISKEIAAAEKGYVSARKNTARAAATTFYVWYHCVSDAALTSNKTWFKGALSKRAEEVNAHNDGVEGDRKAVQKAHKSDLTDLTAKRDGANDLQTRATYDAQIKAIETAHTDKLKALNARRWIAMNDLDREPETTISRYVLQMNEQNTRSTVSRFSYVLRWLINELAGKGPTQISEVMAMIEAKGFDEAYEIGKGIDNSNGTGSSNGTTSNSTASTGGQGVMPSATTRAAVAAHFETTIRTAAPIASLPLIVPAHPGALVSLIGRVDASCISIVGSMDVPNGDLFKMAIDYGESRLLPVDHPAEFVATALKLGELITETDATNKPPQVTRDVVMIAEGEPYLLVSPRGTKAGVVVQAFPLTPPSNDLFPKSGYWTTYEREHRSIAEVVADPIARKVVTLARKEVVNQLGDAMLSSDFLWEASNKALGVTTACHWIALSTSSGGQLRVDGFQPTYQGTVTRDELMKLVSGGIGDTANAKPAGGNKTCTVSFAGSSITVSTPARADTIACTASSARVGQVTVQTIMVHALVHKLAAAVAAQYEFRADKNGALGVFFSTAHGRFAVYLPTCDEKHALVSKRFSEIDI